MSVVVAVVVVVVLVAAVAVVVSLLFVLMMLLVGCCCRAWLKARQQTNSKNLPASRRASSASISLSNGSFIAMSLLSEPSYKSAVGTVTASHCTGTATITG